MFDRLGHELRLACRALSKSPGYAATVLLILTLGIGVNSTVFSVIRTLYGRPPAEVAEPERLVRLNHFSRASPGGWWSFPDFAFFRDQSRTFSGLSAYTSTPTELPALLGEAPQPLGAVFCSGNYFELLGVVPAAGRFFVPDEDQVPPSRPAVVLSYEVWQRHFGGRPDVPGASFTLGDQLLTVVGVAPRGFTGVSPAEVAPGLWLPIATKPLFSPSYAKALVRDPNFFFVWLQVLGRLAPGVERAAAESDLSRVSALLGQEVPSWKEDGEGANLLPDFRYSFRDGERITRLVRLMSAVAAVVLVIAIFNLSLLALARAASRTAGAGVRLALGAERWQILRGELLEGALLAVVGATMAFLVAFLTSGWLAAALPFRAQARFVPDLWVLVAALGLSLLVAMLGGLGPAFFAGRTEVLSVLKSAAPRSAWGRFRRGLGVAQIALAVALLAGAAAFVASFQAANRVELGFSAEERTLVPLGLMQFGIEGERSAHLVAGALRQLAEVPGLEAVSSLDMLPFSGMISSTVRPVDGEGGSVDAVFNRVGPGALATIEIPLLLGREFAFEDHLGSPPVAVVSRSAAEKLWPGRDALGQRLTEPRADGSNGPTYTVVGVMADHRFEALDEGGTPRVFVAALQNFSGNQTLVLRSRLPAAALQEVVRNELRGLEPKLASVRVEPMAGRVDRQLRPFRVGATLMGFFAGLAVLLTAVGLYGVLAFEVGECRRAIGVCLALGSSRQRVARQVLYRGLKLAAFGVPLGVLGAFWGSRFVTTFLFAHNGREPWSLALVAVFALAVVAAASALPAWRASRVDPVEMLREG